jgi:hypothetical protein
MTNPGVPFGRDLRVPSLEQRESSFNQSTILYGRHSVNPWSPNVTVGAQPYVIKAFGLQDGEELTLYNVFRTTKEKMYYGGADFVLTNTNNVLFIPLAGIYALYTTATLGAIRCIAYPVTALDAKARQRNDVQNPNGPQSNLPNTYFSGLAGVEFSQDFYVGSIPLVFRAYGLTTQTIQLMQRYDDDLETQVIENAIPIEHSFYRLRDGIDLS